MTTRPAPVVVFDLDGTLIDTAPDLIATLNVILAREGLASLPYAQGRNLIGGGARKLIERGLAAEGRLAGAEEVSRMVTDFIDHYAEHIAEQSRPFEGLIEALDELARGGLVFAVCTNKLEWLSRRLLEQLGLTQRFSAICGADTFGVIKPDPAGLIQTITRAGGTLAGAVMVGDSAADVNVARAAGVPVIGVSFGYTETPIADLAPDHIIDHMRELPEAVHALLARPVPAA
ncbi:MAG: phosphoglycolate phosphatase [Xanthobacteraceae bacterium]|nr:MAG: phosphoglycolate phosphatase [Xanthobacteraceae bacterium]